jgi:hypothetical protein
MAKKKAAKKKMAKPSKKAKPGPRKNLIDEVVESVKSAIGKGKVKRKK